MRGAKGVIISITGGEDMRLMEVDEAANHIKDLVDPDANIIWGSAFNNDLDGKIRVSVVATGIDVVEGSMAPAAPAKVFTFPGNRGAEPARAAAPQVQVQPQAAPVQPAPVQRAAPQVERAPERAPEPVAQAPAEPEPTRDELDLPTPEEASDELLLGEVNMVPEEEADGHMAGDTRSWHAAEEEGEPAPAAKSSGGTLFERMSNIARGAAKAQVDEEPANPRMRRDRDPLDIPRFLNRQNNQ